VGLKIAIEEISPDRLSQYDRVPQRVEVKTILQVELINQGFGGMLLQEVPVEKPYFKDYDASGDLPSDVAKNFDECNWGFFLSIKGNIPNCAATIARDTTGVFMLEARREMAVLWDICVCPEFRGVGILLFRYAAEWSRIRSYAQMKIETQNINVPAWRFYQRMGAHLGEIYRYGYAAVPTIANKVMKNWYQVLTNL